MSAMQWFSPPNGHQLHPDTIAILLNDGEGEHLVPASEAIVLSDGTEILEIHAADPMERICDTHQIETYAWMTATEAPPDDNHLVTIWTMTLSRQTFMTIEGKPTFRIGTITVPIYPEGKHLDHTCLNPSTADAWKAIMGMYYATMDDDLSTYPESYRSLACEAKKVLQIVLGRSILSEMAEAYLLSDR